MNQTAIDTDIPTMATMGSRNINETSSEGQTALIRAVLAAGEFQGSASNEDPVQRIQTLLKLRADPNVAGAKEQTPLHIAATLHLRSMEVSVASPCRGCLDRLGLEHVSTHCQVP